jgi:GNAT superfamily N-acetyltransferase
MRIRKVSPKFLPTRNAIEALDRLCFPDDEPYPLAGSLWWLVRTAGYPLAFAGLHPDPTGWDRDCPGGAAFLCRAGVLPAFRGRGLQKRLIRAREAYAKKHLDKRWLVTYTLVSNPESSNSLIACGFKLFVPAGAEKGTLYWRKETI